MVKTSRSPMMIINDLTTLKVLTDPLRLQILELLDPEPQTVAEVAEKLGFSSSRLYYHFNLLETHGMIQVVETRMLNNLIEKVYWTTAEDLEIEKNLLNFSSEEGQENVTKMISTSLEATREDIMRSIQARKRQLEQGEKLHPRDMLMMTSKKKLKDETYQEFLQKLQDLVKAFDALPDEDELDEKINVYGLACYLYPSYTFSEIKDAERQS